jgi:hypothetical protein
MPLFGVILWVLSHCLTVPRPAERAPSVAPSQQQCVARSPPTILLWSEWWNGRHRRLKISWPHGRAGSIPASDTMRRARSLGRQRTSKWVVCPLGGDAQNIVLTHLVLWPPAAPRLGWALLQLWARRRWRAFAHGMCLATSSARSESVPPGRVVTRPRHGRRVGGARRARWTGRRPCRGAGESACGRLGTAAVR